jgi:hypothetical protein
MTSVTSSGTVTREVPFGTSTSTLLQDVAGIRR